MGAATFSEHEYHNLKINIITIIEAKFKTSIETNEV
jgi:hypothetical protein